MIDFVSVDDKVMRISGIPYQKGTLYIRLVNDIFTIGSNNSKDFYSGKYDNFGNNGTSFTSTSSLLAYVEVNFF